MKIHPYGKLLGNTLAGIAAVLATTGSAQAVDIGAPVVIWHIRPASTQLQAPTPEAALVSPTTQRIAPKGAQGPIRTEEFSERSVKVVDYEMLRDDLHKQRYPMANGVGIP